MQILGFSLGGTFDINPRIVRGAQKDMAIWGKKGFVEDQNF